MKGKRSVARREASLRSQRPLARVEGLVVEELEEELLVYDQRSNRAHCLSSTAAMVWRACDGETRADAFVERLNLGEDSVRLALQELADCELLDDGPSILVGNGGMTRRDLSLRAAKVGTAAAAVPLIWSITAPVPAAAATPTVEECARYSDASCDGCRSICGCCCCCQKGTTSPFESCKLCYPTRLCGLAVSAGGTDCRGSFAPKCSAEPPTTCTPAGVTVNCHPPIPGNNATTPCCVY